MRNAAEAIHGTGAISDIGAMRERIEVSVLPWDGENFLQVRVRDFGPGVPPALAHKVLQLAQEIEAAEDQIRSAIESGMRLDEARKRFGYHTLQRRAK